MIDEKVFLRLPIQFKKTIMIYPPSVREAIEFSNFSFAMGVLTISQDDITDSLTDYGKKDYDGTIPTPWQYLWINALQDAKSRMLIESYISFFTHTKVYFLPEHNKIFIGDLDKLKGEEKQVENLPFLEESDYFKFQNIIRMAVGIKLQPEPTNEKLHPKILRMRALARYRDKVKATSKDGIKFSTTLISLCCMGIGITPLNVGEIGYASISPLFEMCQNKAQYETEVRSLQAGADPKKLKPKYWIHNFEE